MSAYRETPGNAGAQLLTRDLDNGVTEIVTLSWWESLDHIRAFAGADVESAKYYPEDDEYLIERDATASHYEVVPAT
jgi:heme-degrading monooxygenase HmoA